MAVQNDTCNCKTTNPRNDKPNVHAELIFIFITIAPLSPRLTTRMPESAICDVPPDI